MSFPIRGRQRASCAAPAGCVDGGFTEDELLASRYRLIEKMRADLLADIHVQTDRFSAICSRMADCLSASKAKG